MKQQRKPPVSFSQLKAYKQCPWFYNQTYNEGIRRVTTRLRIAEGDFIHRLLAALYRKEDWRALWASIKDEYANAQMFEEDAEEIEGLADRVLAILDRYERLVYPKVIANATVIAVEEEFIIKVNNVYGRGLPRAVVIKPDLVLDTPEGVWVWDHKTTRDFEEDLEENLRYDDQMSLYLWGLRALHEHIAGGVHDMIRTRLPRFPGYTQKGLLSRQACVTDEETIKAGVAQQIQSEPDRAAALLADSENYLATMKMSVFFQQPVTFRSDAVLDQLANEYFSTWKRARRGPWTRTFTTRGCPTCPLRELCMADLQGGDVESLMQTTFRRRGEEPAAREVPTELQEAAV